MKYLLILLLATTGAFAQTKEQAKIVSAIRENNLQLQEALALAEIENTSLGNEALWLEILLNDAQKELQVALTENFTKQNLLDAKIAENLKLEKTIEHHISFARQIAILAGTLAALAAFFGVLKLTGNLKNPVYVFGIPSLTALTTGYAVYTTITIYASKIA